MAGKRLNLLRREQFLRRFPTNAVGAEIGVFRGEFTQEILRIAQPRRLHLIDAWWTLYGETYPDWGAYTDFGRLKTRDAYSEVLALTRAYAGIAECEIHVGDDREILHTFEDEYFDWVYLDTSHHYDHTCRELEILIRKVKPHGVIAGHDWYEDPLHQHHGVSRAVRKICRPGVWQVTAPDPFGQWIARRR